MSDGLRLTLRDAFNLMMLVSDNTATNLVLEVLTTDAVNARMESLGFNQIKIMRKVGSGGESKAGKDPDNKRFGRLRTEESITQLRTGAKRPISITERST